MNVPPVLLGATILFWGFQTGAFLLAVLMAFATEMPRWTKRRWDFEDSDFRRSLEIVILLTGGAAVYTFLTRGMESGIMQLLRVGDVLQREHDEPQTYSVYLLLWAPILTLPILLTQIYSAKGTVPLRAFTSYLKMGKRNAPSNSRAR